MKRTCGWGDWIGRENMRGRIKLKEQICKNIAREIKNMRGDIGLEKTNVCGDIGSEAQLPGQ